MARGALVALGAVADRRRRRARSATAVTRKATGGMTPQATRGDGRRVGALDGDIKARARQRRRSARATLAGLQPVRAAVGDRRGDREGHARERRARVQAAARRGDRARAGAEGGRAGDAARSSPTGAMHGSHAGKPGSFAELMSTTGRDHRRRRGRADEARRPVPGYVMVSRPLDLGPAIEQLSAAGVTGRFELGDASSPVGGCRRARPMHDETLPSQPDVKLVVAVPPKAGGDADAGRAAGGAAIGLLLGSVGLDRAVSSPVRHGRPPTAAPRAGSSAPRRPSCRGTGVAAGTPSPVGRCRRGASIVADEPRPRRDDRPLGDHQAPRLGRHGRRLSRALARRGRVREAGRDQGHAPAPRAQPARGRALPRRGAARRARFTHPNVVADPGPRQDRQRLRHRHGVRRGRRPRAPARVGARRAAPGAASTIALGILCRICDGLNAAHTRDRPDGTPLSIIHRDVKSANVLVSQQGGVKVVDFGIAKAAKQVHSRSPARPRARRR